jgi:HK97 gp10 family phage protein
MSAFVTAKLEGDLGAMLDRFSAKVTEPVLFSGAAAMARVVYAEVLVNTQPPKLGIKTGNLHASIYWAKDAKTITPTRKVYNVSWNKSKAPHGHLLEYGTSRAPAHPFMRPSASALPSAIKAGLARMHERLAEVTQGALAADETA